MNADSIIDDQGRIRIPSDLRKKLNFHPGEKVLFKIENNKLVITKALTSDEFLEKARTFRKHLGEITDKALPPIKKIFD